ncbi:MAG: serine/threonine protein kinase, partial [Candidatus Melainabacteria bacterium]|nr:serine/threonine protein kinase [Candidatus Melainabacteria bacterium]
MSYRIEVVDSKALIGSVLADRYEILCLVGEGGMSVVYKGRHQLMDRLVAVKMLKAHLVSNPSILKRFQQEAKAISYLTHPNIVSVFDFGILPQPYLVMDYLQGISLDDLIEESKGLKVERAIHIFGQICNALTHAHQKGLIHRDLKPGNIMLVRSEDEDDFVKIVDFGIAKLMPWAQQDFQKLTQTGEAFGSPVYMSPEQCLAEELDNRSDIYSLGCVMYETLTGRPPLVGSQVLETMYKHLNATPVALGAIRPDLCFAESLEKIVLKCLRKKPEERYQSMKELKEDLLQVTLRKSSGVPIMEKQNAVVDKLERNVPRISAMVYVVLLALIGVASAFMLFPPTWQGTTSDTLDKEALWARYDQEGVHQQHQGHQVEAEEFLKKALDVAENLLDQHQRFTLSGKRLINLYRAQGR